jgi:ribosomal protein L7/L12
VSLVLNEYAPDKKVNVIRVLRENVPGCSLTKAKALVERGLPLEEAKAIGSVRGQLAQVGDLGA